MRLISQRITKSTLLAILILVSAFCVHAKNKMEYRFLWEQGRIMRNPNGFKELITQAAGFGYNGMIFVDYELQTIEAWSQSFFDKYESVKNHAKKHNVELCPWVLWQGFPAYENFNLGESFPVKNSKFIVGNEEAWAVGDHDVGLKNAGFESGTANWGLSNLSGKYVIDKTVFKSGTASFCVKDARKYSAITQKISLKPFRAYEISAWFKTGPIKNALGVKFQVVPQLLARIERPFGTPKNKYHKNGIWTNLKGNMNWTKCVADFNSLKETTTTLQLVFADEPQGGNIWVDDIEVREVGLYETMRGKSRPIVVRSADESITYQEGKDYVVDPKCNSMTLETYNYEGHLKIPAGSAIKDEQELRVDWFQYANAVTIVPASDFCLPETWYTMRDNVKKIDDLMGHANAAFSKYSEYRLGAWSQDCECFKFTTGGEYLAKVAEGSECVLRTINNGCRAILTECDMFDPYYNGYDGPYRLWSGPGPSGIHGLYGGTYGSYMGLGSEMIIINWNTAFGQAYTDSSLLFFAGLDPKYPNVKTKQILNVLDGGKAVIYCNTLDRLEKKGLEGVVGMHYTDWFNDRYDLMGPVANVFRARGRWGTNPFPTKQCAPLKKCQGFNPPEGPSILDHGSQTNTLQSIHLRSTAASQGVFAIQYSVPEYGKVSLKVFDLLGREVSTLVNEKKEIATHRVVWKTSNLSTGVYFLRMSIDGTTIRAIKQMVY